MRSGLTNDGAAVINLLKIFLLPGRHQVFASRGPKSGNELGSMDMPHAPVRVCGRRSPEAKALSLGACLIQASNASAT